VTRCSRWAVALTVIGAVLVPIGAGASTGSRVPLQVQAEYTPTGTIVADNGFRPPKHGFSFPNYGVESPYANLSSAEMRRLFGNVVCATKPSDSCALIPPADLWEQAINQQMGGGHCFGFSVTSLELFTHELAPKTFGASRTPDIRIDGNDAMQRQLAYAWATQVLDSMHAATISATPNEQLDRLRQILKPGAKETYTIAIFSQSSGHAVTPYAIEDRGDGTFAVLIYDNNWPGITRAVIFDTNANTWAYDLDSGMYPEALWSGDATTPTLLLVPTSPGRGKQPCPFCGGGSFVPPRPIVNTSYKDVFLQGGDAEHGHLLVTDDHGRRFGYVGSQFVTEIPEVQAIRPLLDVKVWEAQPEPIYRIPADLDVSLTVDGSTLATSDTTDLMLIGPGYDAAVRDIELQPGQTDQLSVAGDGTGLTYTTTNAQAPHFELGTLQERSSYAFVVSDHEVAPGTEFAMSFEPDSGKLNVTSGAEDVATYNLTIRQLSRVDTKKYTHRDIALPAGTESSVAYGAWKAERQPIAVKSVSPSGQERTRRLENQAKPQGG
jgi:hypothetical protein